MEKEKDFEESNKIIRSTNNNSIFTAVKSESNQPVDLYETRTSIVDKLKMNQSTKSSIIFVKNQSYYKINKSYNDIYNIYLLY